MELRYIATRDGRLSHILREDMKLSAGLVNRMKWQEKIFVNGIPQHNDYQVHIGDVITLPLDEPEPEYPPEDGPLTVLYEDEYLLAVDKEPGMLIHPSRSRLTGTLANRVWGYYLRTGQRSVFHPMTRLDRDTYGIVLLAKNSHIHTLLQSVPMKKTYHALVYSGPKDDHGFIDVPIARKELPSLLREVRSDGKPSLTEYSVLERSEILCKLSLHPITGRTHQLRVHCAHMGFPILGDPQYGTEASRAFSEELGLTHQWLCAVALEFPHPITGEPMFLTSRMDATI